MYMVKAQKLDVSAVVVVGRWEAVKAAVRGPGVGGCASSGCRDGRRDAGVLQLASC